MKRSGSNFVASRYFRNDLPRILILLAIRSVGSLRAARDHVIPQSECKGRVVDTLFPSRFRDLDTAR